MDSRFLYEEIAGRRDNNYLDQSLSLLSQQARAVNFPPGIQFPPLDHTAPASTSGLENFNAVLEGLGQQSAAARAQSAVKPEQAGPAEQGKPPAHQGPGGSSSSGNSTSNLMEGEQATDQSPQANDVQLNGLPDEPGVKQKLREKNRNAQRRFRERQKAVVLTLQLQVDLLTRQLDELRREKLVIEEQNKALVMQLEHMESLVRPILVNQLTSRPN